ncbi:MAG: EpsI family protein, partial [Gemmatimonadetes bacterium]|nr:EpsI family protein [Gemmatimonadota bacterium]
MKLPWVPTLILVLGAVLTLGAAEQNTLPLRRPLGEVVPMEVQGHLGQDLTVPDDEAAVAGFSNYLFRLYEKAEPGQTDLDPPAADPEAVSPQGDSTTVGIEPPSSSFSLYVGYYESQTQGNTIHSPKNCLPGAGWEPLSSEPVAIEVGGRAVTVNKYLLQNGSQQALVLYWYQGRG